MRSCGGHSRCWNGSTRVWPEVPTASVQPACSLAPSKPRSPDHKIQLKVENPRKCQSQPSPQTTATEHLLCTCNPSMCEAEAGGKTVNSRSAALSPRASSRPVPASYRVVRLWLVGLGGGCVGRWLTGKKCLPGKPWQPDFSPQYSSRVIPEGLPGIPAGRASRQYSSRKETLPQNREEGEG